MARKAATRGEPPQIPGRRSGDWRGSKRRTKNANAATPPVAAARIPSAARPTATQIAAEAGVVKEMKPVAGRANSDFMVDVIKSLDIDYVYSNPASSFRGLHESLINYGKNSKPEFITCMHEESAIAMAHAYFKVTGKPQMSLCHGTVGLQHGAMAVYNAWCDRAAVLVMGGTDLDAARSRAGRADHALRAGHQCDRARLHQVGRPAGVAAALRAVDGPRLQVHDDASA